MVQVGQALQTGDVGCEGKASVADAKRRHRINRRQVRIMARDDGLAVDRLGGSGGLRACRCGRKQQGNAGKVM
jgi:hypothetical protein